MQQAMQDRTYSANVGQDRDTQSACMALVHLTQGSQADGRFQQMIHAAGKQIGVQSVHPSGKPGNVALVEYDRNQTAPSQIVDRLRRLGYRAVLVGC